MLRRRWVLSVLAALVAFGVAYGVAVRDDEEPASSEVELDLDALPSEARELVSLAARGAQGAHHAVYEQPTGEQLEVWVDGEQAREESTLDDGTRRLVVRRGDEATTCESEGDGDDWACEGPTDDPVGLEGRVDQLLADLQGASVAARDDTVAGIDVRCFDVTSGEGEVSVCVTAEGVVARLAAGDARLELVELDDEAPDDGFEAPE